MEREVAEVARSLGLRPVGRLEGGMHGAYEVLTTKGERRVLKLFPRACLSVVGTGLSTASLLRPKGYPVPDPYSSGTRSSWAYSLRGYCEGERPTQLSLDHARGLTGWWELQLGACVGASGYGQEVARALTVGTPALWAEHEPIRRAAAHEREGGLPKNLYGETGIAGRAAEELLDEIVGVGSAVDLRSLTDCDAMHDDFQYTNILVEGATVKAVIDWEAARPGDARYDLVCFLFWAEVQRGRRVSHDAAEHLAHFTEASVEPGARRALAALYALHQLWFCAERNPGALEEMVGHVTRHLRPYWL